MYDQDADLPSRRIRAGAETSCQRRKSSMAEIIREAVERRMKRRRKKISAGKALLLMAKKAGRGPADLSSNIFEYL